MSNAGDIQIDYELLAKYLSGEAAPEEAMAVDSWIQASAENSILFDQVSTAWDNASEEQKYHLPDKGKVLEELRRKLQPVTNSVYPIRNKHYWRNIAAVLLVLIGAASLGFLFRGKDTHVKVAYVTRQTGTAIYRDTLPDHSVVAVNSHSAIKYAAGLREKVRAIHLTGEAWFDVTTDAAKPFIVSVGDIEIKVLGTAFNVKQDTAAVEVVVKTGAVRMYRGDSGITVKAGERGIYHTDKGVFAMGGSFQTNKISYGTRVFNFENASLKNIAAQLEKAYGITIVFENKKLENCMMSSSFENKSIKYIFEIISITLNVECRIESERVYISGAGCN
jgi:transmembrane sensor